MKVVFYGFPARGHTVPSLSVVRALVDRGAEVVYHSTTAFQSLIEGAGARFVAYPSICESLSEPAELTEHLERVLAVTAAILPDLLGVHEERADLVIFDGSALWGRVVAQRRAVPSVESITTFALGRSMLQMLGIHPEGNRDYDAPHARVVEELNRDYGMSLRDHLDVMAASGELKLVHTSREFQPAGKFLDASHLFVGPQIDQRPREGASVGPEGSRPLAYVSLGTIFNEDLDLLRQISGALSASGWQVVVALGAAGRTDPGGWSPHVRAHSFVDQIGVLSHARLMVTHGGMNSVSEALAFGVPLIIIPQAVDQYLVARRAADLGAAIVVEPGDVSLSTLEAAIARIAAERPAFEAAATRIARSFDEVAPLAGALDRVLGLVDGSTEGC